MKSIEEIRAYFGQDQYAAGLTGIQIDKAEKQYAQVSLEIGQKHKNAVGNVMGGVIAVIADYAFAVASNVENDPTVTLNSSIAFTGAATGKRLLAEATCLKEGHTTCTYLIRVTDETERLVATVTTVGFIKRSQGEK